MLGATVLATESYDVTGQLATVSYSNGTALTDVGKDAVGRPSSLTWKTSDNTTVISQVSRSRACTIVDESLGGQDARPSGANYVYDSVGRMTEAYVPGHHYTYDFTSTASAACPTGTQANAGLNTNRVRLSDAYRAGEQFGGPHGDYFNDLPAIAPGAKAATLRLPTGRRSTTAEPAARPRR